MPSPTPTPTPTPTVTPPIVITPPGKGAGTPDKETDNNSKTSDGILWIESYSTPQGYQPAKKLTKSEAKAAYESGTLTATQNSVVQRGYAAYVAGGGKKKINGWFSTIIDGATGTVSPFQNIISKYKLGGGSYTTQGGTTTITDGTTPSPYTGPTTPRFVGTSRADMDYFIDSTIQAAFNRPATKAEKESFAKQYAAGEKAANKQAQTGKGSGWSKDQYTKDFLTQTLRNELGKEPDAQLLGDAGGFQDMLEQYAADMGLTKTLRGINRDVVRIMKGESVNDVMRDYKNEAIIMFKPLADRLKADSPANLAQGLKVKDILSPYTSYIEDLTDKTRGTVKLTDGIVQKIMNSDALPDMGTVNQWVRETTDFAKSTTAKKEAQDLGVSFLRAFGYGSK